MRVRSTAEVALGMGLPDGMLLGSRYRIVRELGRGGMGVVYEVEHQHTGERLALKLLHGMAAGDPAAGERFQREARVAARIRSEHVVRVTDADFAPELGGAPFLVMELLSGMDLEELLRRTGRLPSDLVVRILADAARALDKAHATGIVHRDLKTENIFLHHGEDGKPTVKLLDFGISKFLVNEQVQGGPGATSDGALIGTPYYMAPEQARGDIEQIGAATDVWAVGLVALRMLTADLYWTARTHTGILVQVVNAPMPAPSSRWPFLDEKLDAWFARSCDRDPARRWTSVGEQVAALGIALGQPGAIEGGEALADTWPASLAFRPAPAPENSPSTVLAASVRERAVRVARGSRLVMAGLGLGLLVVLLAAYVVRANWGSAVAPLNPGPSGSPSGSSLVPSFPPSASAAGEQPAITPPEPAFARPDSGAGMVMLVPSSQELGHAEADGSEAPSVMPRPTAPPVSAVGKPKRHLERPVPPASRPQASETPDLYAP